jgi:hypothetical protein
MTSNLSQLEKSGEDTNRSEKARPSRPDDQCRKRVDDALGALISGETRGASDWFYQPVRDSEDFRPQHVPAKRPPRKLVEQPAIYDYMFRELQQS